MKLRQTRLAQYGLSYDDMDKVEFTKWRGMIDLYKDKHVDAVFACSTPGLSAFQEMSLASGGIKIIGLSDKAIKGAIGENFGYFPATLPGGIYKGNDTSVETLGSTTILFARADQPDDIAYGIVKNLLVHKDELIAALKDFKDLDNEFAPKIPGIQIHPGSAKYYREVGSMK